MKHIYEKRSDIETISIESSTFWIRKYIDISQKEIVRYTVKPCSEIPLSENQQSPINNHKLTAQNYQ
ncbi:hypothetical protein C6497_01305 [Candidatus Poribacteria bacterium]|nr:MAG: hypothetical protein C6497_01305 [Candidatus Poribacteria bacterium]